MLGRKTIGQLGLGRKPVKIKAIRGPEEFFFSCYSQRLLVAAVVRAE